MRGDGFDRARILLEPYRFGFARVTLGLVIFQRPITAIHSRLEQIVIEAARQTLPANINCIETEFTHGLILPTDCNGSYSLLLCAARRADLSLLKTAATLAGSALPLPNLRELLTFCDQPQRDDELQCEFPLRWYAKLLDSERYAQSLPDDRDGLLGFWVCDDALGATWGLVQQTPSHSAGVAIPAMFRTRAISKRKASGYLRGGNSDSAVDWLNQCIRDGTISCETLSRQSHVFDVRQFPENMRASLLPK